MKRLSKREIRLEDRAIWLAVALLTLLIVLVIYAWYSGAWAHSWYPQECCQEGDCRPVPCSGLSEEVRLTGHGTVINLVVYTADGKRYFAKADQVRSSPDGKCHACFWHGTFNMRCVFKPQRLS